MRSKMSKLILTFSLVFCMTAAFFTFDVNAAENASATKIDDCSKVFKAYTAERVSSYLDSNKYPTKEGYLFAGWYTTDELPENDEEAVEYAIEDSVPNGTEIVYALFVPDDVLTVQAQVSSHLIDSVVEEKDTAGVIRFVTSVDSLLYKKAGFEISYKDAEGNVKTGTSASSKVYKKLYEADSTKEWTEKTPEGTFCGASKYFKACTVKGISEQSYITEFTVRPFWVTISGDKVYGETATKVFEDGCFRDEVYVSSTVDISADTPYYGTEANPYATLDYAIAHVKDGGIVRVKDSLTVASDATWTKHDKTITITGNSTNDGEETLDFSTQSSHLNIRDNVTFSNLNLKLKQYVFGNGYHVKVASDVTVLENETGTYIYGGAQTTSVENTNLELYAGSYLFIYGGGHNENAHVTGNTNIVVGPGVNASADTTSHEKQYLLYGGCRMASVGGNTNVTVLEAKEGQTPAKFNYIYGAGGYASGTKETAIVEGTTNVNFAGESYAVYGGGRYGTNADTCVVMTGGSVYQIFGGCENNSMTGNADVQVLGGTVKRRIYGGCYNDNANSWGTDNHVKGNIFVTIGAEATVALNVESDNSLYALTRDSITHDDEKGVFIFDDYQNSSSNINKIGPDSLVQSAGVSTKTHHYQVNASAGGKVMAADNCIYIEPKDNNKASVRLDSTAGTIVYYAEEAGYYPLPELVNGEREIYVSFDKTEATDFINNAAAKINIGNDANVYYATLEEALVAAEKSDKALVTAISATNVASILIADSVNGTVTSNYKNCVAGTEVTLTVEPKTGYYCSALTVKKDGQKIELPALTLTGKTYAFTAEEGAYTVEASFVKQVFTNPTSAANTKWDLLKQNESMESLANGATKITGQVTATDLKGDGKNFNTLNFVEKYTDMSLAFTVKETQKTPESYSKGTQVVFDFDGYVLQIRVTHSGGKNYLRVVGGINTNTNVHTFTEAQAAAYNGDGVEVRFVRYGTTLYMYVDGEQTKTPIDLNAYSTAYTKSEREVTASTEMTVGFKFFSDAGNELEIPFSIIDMVTPANVNVNKTTNGTVTVNKTQCFTGDKVTVSLEPDNTSYYCRELNVTNSKGEVSLLDGTTIIDKATTFEFEIGEGLYKVDATFAKKVFKTPTTSSKTVWGLLEQNTRSENLPNGGTRVFGTINATSINGNAYDVLDFYEYSSYKDVDFMLTVKDDPDAKEGTKYPVTTITLNFGKINGTDYILQLQVKEVEGQGVVLYNNSTNLMEKGNLHIFETDEETSYKSKEGIPVRIVREGTELALYVGEKECYTADLATLSNGDITSGATLKSGFNIRRYGDNNTPIAMPFSIANEVSQHVVISTTGNGTVTKGQKLYQPGDTVTLTVTPESTSYYCRELNVTNSKGEVVSLLDRTTIIDKATTFEFEVEEGLYEVDATFAKKVFTTPSKSTSTLWNLLEQNTSSETLLNGGTRISGTIYATTQEGVTTGTDNLAFINPSSYTDVDLVLTVKNDPYVTAGEKYPVTTITLDFGKINNVSYVFQLQVKQTADKTVTLYQNHDSLTNKKTTLYTFSEDETTRYTSMAGVKVRVVREGLDIRVYIDGVQRYTGNLGTLSNSAITANKALSGFNIRRYGDNGTAIEMPFSIANKVSPATVEVQKNGTIVTTSDVPSNTQNIDLDSNETYNVTITNSGMTINAYYKISYVDHVTKETQSVYTPAVTAGESFEFTYQNGLFDIEKEATIATIRRENRIKATKDVLTIEVVSGAPEGETIEVGTTLGNAPMAKPASTTVSTTWTKGKNVASDKHGSYPNSITAGQDYAHTGIIHIAKKGTKLTFTDNKKNSSWASDWCYVVSSWKQTETGEWELDLEGTNIRGKEAASQLTCTEGYEPFVERYGTDTSDADGSITYTYITSKDDEYIRFCYFAGKNDDNATGYYPTITSTYSGETGTAEEIALAEATSTWLEKDKTRAYYDIFEGKTLSVIGDSYMAGSSIADTSDVWVNMFATKYNMTMNNHGVNGSTISNFAGSKYNPMVDRWAEDFANDTPDIIVVEGGRNDYNYNTPMGELGNSDKATFKGATTNLISSLREIYPNAIILGITCWEVGGEKNAAGYYCSDYGRAFIEVCEDLGVSYVNAMDSDAMGVYMTSSNYRGRFCIKAGDISHLNEKGMKLVLPVFEQKIYEICASK